MAVHESNLTRNLKKRKAEKNVHICFYKKTLIKNTVIFIFVDFYFSHILFLAETIPLDCYFNTKIFLLIFI